MIIDFDAYRRAHPRQLDLFDEPIPNLASEWSRILMMFPDSKRCYCPGCSRYWYFDEDYMQQALLPGCFLGCIDCFGPLWRIVEEAPSIENKVMFVNRTTEASAVDYEHQRKSRHMTKQAYPEDLLSLNCWEEFGQERFNWHCRDFYSQDFESEEEAVRAWDSGRLEFFSIDDADILGALYVTAEVNYGHLPPFDYWWIDGKHIREPNAGGAYLGSTSDLEFVCSKALKMSELQFDTLQWAYLDELDGT